MKKNVVLTGLIAGKRWLTALLLWPAVLFGQDEFSGKVTDSITGQAVPGALIRIKNSYENTVTDAKGNFNFKDLKAGEAEYSISHISFETLNGKINLPARDQNITLNTRVYLSDEITISATRVNEKNGTAFTDIQKEQIQDQNLGRDLPYLLEMTPSLVVTSDAGTGVGYTGLRIRGSDASRINVTLNGVPVNDAESHQVYWVDLPDLATSIDHIQVQRGLGTSTNGTGAFGGSVNLLSNGLRQKAYSDIQSSAGSFNTWKNSVGFGSGLLGDHFAIEGRLSKITSDGYIDRASSDLKSIYLSGGYYGKQTSVRGVILSGKEKTYQAWYGIWQDSLKTNRTFNEAGLYYDENGNVKYYDNQTDNYQQDYHQLLLTHSFNSNWVINSALFYTKGRGYYEEYKNADKFSTYGLEDVINGPDTLTTSDFIRRRWLDNDFYGITGALQYNKEKLDFKLGWSINRYTGDHFGELIWSKDRLLGPDPLKYYDDSAEKNELSFFAKANYNLSKNFDLFADLQWRQIDYEFIGYDREYNISPQNSRLNFINPKAGLAWQVNPQGRLTGSFGYGSKEPVRDDYVAAGPLSRPKAEKMFDLEAGYRHNTKSLSAGINFYHMQYTDQLILTGRINDVGEYTRENVPESFRQGVELELAWRISNKLSFNGNLTLSNNKIKNYTEYLSNYDDESQQETIYENTEIALSPSAIAYYGLTWEVFSGFTCGINGKYVGKQYLDNTTNSSRSVDAYLVHNLSAEYKISRNWIRELKLKAAVYNLFDTTYVSNGYTYSFIYDNTLSTYNYYFPQAGINFLAGISLGF